MSIDEPDIGIQPEVQLLEAVLRPLSDGALRVPRFQRPFVWQPEQILALFDSIERGYPIGNLLYWEPSEKLSFMDRIGDQPVPHDPPKGMRPSYVLDGHQRLTALFATLRRPVEPPRTTEEDSWKWWPYRVLGQPEDTGQRYQHWKKAEEPPVNYLPVRAMLRTVDFLSFCRGLEDSPELIAEAEKVTQRIREYAIPIVQLKGGSLDKAADVFTRVNTTGRAMSQAEMVSALTYRENSESTLAERIEEIIADIADTGFGEISDKTIFQVVLAVNGEEDFRNPEWSRVAEDMGNTLQETIDMAWEALSSAVDFLRETIQVPVARLVPYDLQLTLLATFFHHCPKPNRAQQYELRQWFWVTSWSGYFATANSTQVRHSLQRIKAFAGGESSLVPEDIRLLPFPERFDQKAARVRAFIIWDLIEHENRLDGNESKIDATQIYGNSPYMAYRRILDMQPAVSSPANRLIFPTKPRVSVRKALLELDARIRDEVLASHGIPVSAWERLADGDNAGFVTARERHLSAKEKAFMKSVMQGELMLRNNGLSASLAVAH